MADVSYPMSGGSTGPRSATWWGSPTVNSTTGPERDSCSRRLPRPRAAARVGSTRTPTCSAEGDQAVARRWRLAPVGTAGGRMPAPRPGRGPRLGQPGAHRFVARSWLGPTERWSTCWPAARACSTSCPWQAWWRSSTPISSRLDTSGRRAGGARSQRHPRCRDHRGRRGVSTPDPSPFGRTRHPACAPAARVRFAHPSERLFAQLLDLSGERWEYEPVEFPLDGTTAARRCQGSVQISICRRGRLRRVDHGRPAAGHPEEPQSAPHALALPGGAHPRGVPAGLPFTPGLARAAATHRRSRLV